MAGAHSFYRGAPPATYDDETRAALAALTGRVDIDLVTRVWETALDAAWAGPAVWFHGDIASGNLLVRDGRLSAVIDFGTLRSRRPACDLVIAYTFFTGASRAAFRPPSPRTPPPGPAPALGAVEGPDHLAADRDTEVNHQVITEVLADHQAQA